MAYFVSKTHQYARFYESRAYSIANMAYTRFLSNRGQGQGQGQGQRDLILFDCLSHIQDAPACKVSLLWDI